jgi:hypothetical protein
MRTQRAARLAVLVAGLAVAVGATSIVPKGAPAPSSPAAERLPSPMLLKRLAEAVDGYRMGQRVFVVASWTPPNHVIGVYGSKDSADAATRDTPDLGVFGPYRAPLEPAMTTPTPQPGGGAGFRMFIGACEHDGRMSDWNCGDTTHALRSIDISDVLTMTLTVKTRQRTYTQTLHKGTDALFMSLPGVDKFALPYYVHTLGIERTAEMRADLVKKLGAR